MYTVRRSYLYTLSIIFCTMSVNIWTPHHVLKTIVYICRYEILYYYMSTYQRSLEYQNTLTPLLSEDTLVPTFEDPWCFLQKGLALVLFALFDDFFLVEFKLESFPTDLIPVIWQWLIKLKKLKSAFKKLGNY